MHREDLKGKLARYFNFISFDFPVENMQKMVAYDINYETRVVNKVLNKTFNSTANYIIKKFRTLEVVSFRSIETVYYFKSQNINCID